MPSAEHQEIVTLLLAMREEQRQQGEPTMAERRARIEVLDELFPLPQDIEIEPVDAGGVPAHWLSAPDGDAGRPILFLHGGAYVAGSFRSHRELAARIARAAGGRALFVDYRLAPESPYPVALEDAVAAYRWMTGAGGADPGGAVIAGDSAGGGLALAATVTLRDAGDDMPQALALLSPWTNLTCSSPSWTDRMELDPVLDPSLGDRARDYLGEADARTPLASPLFADLAGLPPMLVQVGTDEILYDDGVQLAQAARAAGVDVTLEVGDGLIHDWPIFPMLPEAGTAIEQVAGFFAARAGW